MSATFLRLFVYIIATVLLTGCGYHLGQGGLPARYTSISVPYVDNDTDGSMTAELIKHLTTSGAFEYKRTGGDLILYVNLLDFRDENIGFRYYRNKKDELTRETIPVETRLIVMAEVVVVDAMTGKNVLGPVKMSDYTDFDHDYYSTRNAINVFSLGQLTDYDEAYDAAQRPLHQSLAKKIVDYVSDSW